MNIVITQNSNGAASASLTQYSSNLSYLLSDIRVYHKSDIQPSITFISSQGFTYAMTATENKSCKQGDFNAYDLKPSVGSMMPEDSYTVMVTVGDSSVTIGSAIMLQQSGSSDSSRTGIFDEHNCLLVVDRRIQVVANQVSLIAEDSCSQEIRFKIRNRYDNISFLSASGKEVCVDYIPAEWETFKSTDEFWTDVESNKRYASTFLTDKIDSSNIYQDPSNPDYMIIRWVVPYAVTWRAGTVSIALSVTDSDNYIWQTGIAFLNVQPNIGLRDNRATEIKIDSKMGYLEERLGAIEQLFTGNTSVTLSAEQESDKA